MPNSDPNLGNPYRILAEIIETDEERLNKETAALNQAAQKLSDFIFLCDWQHKPEPSAVLRRLSELKADGYGFDLNTANRPRLYRLDNPELHALLTLGDVFRNNLFYASIEKLRADLSKKQVLDGRYGHLWSRLERLLIKLEKKAGSGKISSLQRSVFEKHIQEAKTLKNRINHEAEKGVERWDDIRSRLAIGALLETSGGSDSDEQALVQERHDQIKQAIDSYLEDTRAGLQALEKDVEMLEQVL